MIKTENLPSRCGADEKTGEQVATALKQAELGMFVPVVYRRLVIFNATFYAWHKKYSRIFPSELRHIR